ncbi:MAG: hypothetical protein JJT96_02985 [Opitutales bacterium]|nr:hypothetical protein [Opitutales bacterium]
MITDITEELKQLEKEEARIAKKKEALAARLEKAQEQEKYLDELVEKSGLDPRSLVQALIVKYGVKVQATPGLKGLKTRTRTRITPELRDRIKSAVQENGSKNSVSKEMNISYAVISKVVNGEYDHL